MNIFGRVVLIFLLVNGEIKVFFFVCVCLLEYWRWMIEGDGFIEMGFSSYLLMIIIGF